MRIKPCRSQLEVPCTINPQHVTKTYFEFTVDLPHAMFENDANIDGRVVSRPQIDFAVCPPCMIQFMTDAHEAIRNMNDLL